MKKLFDVVVVGAGPCGAMAAKVAAENGLDVALLERKTDISFIRRCCTGCLGLKDEFMGEIQHFDDKTRRLIFSRYGFSVKYDGPYHNIYGFHLISPLGTKVKLGDVNMQKAKGNDGRVAVIVDKGLFIKGIVDEALANGVKAYFNTNVVDVWNEPEGVAVCDSRGNVYKGKFVIAADGVNSRLVRRLGLNEGRKWLGTYKDRAWDFEGAAFDEMEALIFCIGWNCSISLAPHVNEKLYHVAAASYDWRTDLEGGMQEFLHSPAFGPWFKNARESGHRTSCVSNIYATMLMPFKNNVLVAGDATWMQECAIIGSLLMGWKAGNSVTLAVKQKQINKEGVADYVNFYTKELIGRYGTGGGSGIDFNDYFTAEDMDYMASIVTNPLRATLDFYTLYRTIGKTYLDLFPRIQEERPDIMEKLFSMRNVHPEVGLQKRRSDGFLSVT
jgi:flavin-dependent dehydrogenase